MKLGWAVAALLAAQAASAAAGPKGMKLYVAGNGSDTWSGTLAAPNRAKTDGPFATLERARDEVRARRKAGTLPAGEVTLFVRAGAYWSLD